MEKSYKLSFKSMLGYSIGAWGDYTAYGFIFTFLSFFLTTVAGVSPAVSGVVISVALFWSAITDPLVGVAMDRSRSKFGKRRPFIAASVVPLGASIVLLFLDVPFDQSVKNVYYLVMVLIFWLTYSLFNIPFYSLGSVVARDDTDRTKIAGIRQVSGFIGTFCASTLPTFLLGKLIAAGVATNTAWLYISLVVAVIVLVTISIMWRSTRGLEPLGENVDRETQPLRDVLKDIGHVLRLKPYLIIIVCALAMNVNMALFNANVMYFGTYNLGLTDGQVSTLFLAQTITSIALAFVLTPLGIIFDKKYVFIVAMCLSGTIMVVAKIMGLTTYPAAVVYMILVSIGPAAYWMFIFNFVYDVIDYDQATSGTRKDGIIMSVYSFLLKLGGALASLLMGLALQASGFNAEAPSQSGDALSTIESLYTVFPGLFVLLSGLIVLLNPLTREKMRRIQEQLSGELTEEHAPSLESA